MIPHAHLPDRVKVEMAHAELFSRRAFPTQQNASQFGCARRWRTNSLDERCQCGLHGPLLPIIKPTCNGISAWLSVAGEMSRDGWRVSPTLSLSSADSEKGLTVPQFAPVGAGDSFADPITTLPRAGLVLNFQNSRGDRPCAASLDLAALIGGTFPLQMASEVPPGFIPLQVQSRGGGTETEPHSRPIYFSGLKFSCVLA